MNRYILKKLSPADAAMSLIQEDSVPLPEPGSDEVLVKIKACSLNYRDLLVKSGKSASGGDGPVVPLSDGAGEVVQVGEAVSNWKKGDRVVLTFFQEWDSGPFDMKYHKAARGGSCDGVLSEFVCAPAKSMVAMPDHLDFAEAATLPCAAVTAWQSLMERPRNPVGESDTVLCLGNRGSFDFCPSDRQGRWSASHHHQQFR